MMDWLLAWLRVIGHVSARLAIRTTPALVTEEGRKKWLEDMSDPLKMVAKGWSRTASASSGANSGGGGGECVMGWYKYGDFVTNPFVTNDVVIGAGGVAPELNTNDWRGFNGGDTTVGGIITAHGGRGGGINQYGDHDHNLHGGAGGGATGGIRKFEWTFTRNSTFGGGCGGDCLWANDRYLGGGHSVYGGGGGRGGYNDTNPVHKAGTSTFGGKGGGRGQDGQISAGGGGCRVGETAKGGNGAQGKVILKILQ